MGISLEWAGGSSAPLLSPNLTFPRATAPGKEAGASQGTGPSTGACGTPWDTWEGPAEYSMSLPVPGETFPANSPLPEPFSLPLNSLDLANPEENAPLDAGEDGKFSLSKGVWLPNQVQGAIP